MTSERDMDQLIRTRLLPDEQVSAERIVGRVIDLIGTKPQHRSWRDAWRLGDRWPSIRLASFTAIVATLAIVAVVAVDLLPHRNAAEHQGDAASAMPSATRALAPTPTPSIDPDGTGSTPVGPGRRAIDPGPYQLAWPGGPIGVRVELTVPAGWWRWDFGQNNEIDRGACCQPGAQPVLRVATSTVSRVVTSVCASDPAANDVGPIFADVRSTIDDLAAAIGGIGGIHATPAQDLTIDGYPAKRIDLTYDSRDCAEWTSTSPGRRWLWGDAGGYAIVEDGMATRVYVIDIDGHPLVITTDLRDSSVDGTAEKAAELAAMIGSIRIIRPEGELVTPPPTPSPATGDRFPESAGPDGALRIGRHPATVEGIPFSFEIPALGWDSQLGFFVSKSTDGHEGAEAVLRWTTFPDGDHSDPCQRVSIPSRLASAAQLGSAMAAIPGLDLVAGPASTIVGDRKAVHFVVKVERDTGCDPAFFYSYDVPGGGALWAATKPGDTIRVWIVEVDDRLMVIEGETRPGVTVEAADDIERMVASMRFD
jgi:hypothetical protein